MAIIDNNGAVTYKGGVFNIYSHYWADGMVSEYAQVWNIDEHKKEEIQIGYYGSDGYNFCGTRGAVDLDGLHKADIIATERAKAKETIAKAEEKERTQPAKDIPCKVIRGRKVPKGTLLTPFWIGERTTYTGRGTEKIAGAYTEDGQKVWIKEEYLERLEKGEEWSESKRAEKVETTLKATLRAVYNID